MRLAGVGRAENGGDAPRAKGRGEHRAGCLVQNDQPV
jgi:hypothetical protein